VATSLGGLSSVRGAVAPTGSAWQSGGSALVMVLPQYETGTSQAGSSLADVQQTAPRGVLVGGDDAQNVAQVSATYGAFPLMFALVALVTFLLLARGLKSILLPAKAVLLNALSVAATYGIVVLVWQHGFGTDALWGVSGTGSLNTFVPLLMFGFLFGISMDYEVFILSRVREGYDRTGSTHQEVLDEACHGPMLLHVLRMAEAFDSGERPRVLRGIAHRPLRSHLPLPPPCAFSGLRNLSVSRRRAHPDVQEIRPTC
jgi:RND superfamily putative drug exporter